MDVSFFYPYPFYFILFLILKKRSPSPVPCPLQENPAPKNMLQNLSAQPTPLQTIYNVKYFANVPHRLQLVASNNPANKYCTDEIYKYINIYIYIFCK